ncbi:hypothetical protein [Paraburkholderia sp. J11-2]|uniref:hypothetical protein n=1 Tax=Paraburkholderia sp. J11-2 TaxID=2805431 RepID=UPI002AB775B9|nr:hypothetical protein [Paraburkholderia sp. J11-2]
MTEHIELAAVIHCEGGLELDNADLVLAFDEHFDGTITLRAKNIVFRAKDEVLIRAIQEAIKQRAKAAKDEAAMLGLEVQSI